MITVEAGNLAVIPGSYWDESDTSFYPCIVRSVDEDNGNAHVLYVAGEWAMNKDEVEPSAAIIAKSYTEIGTRQNLLELLTEYGFDTDDQINIAWIMLQAYRTREELIEAINRRNNAAIREVSPEGLKLIESLAYACKTAKEFCDAVSKQVSFKAANAIKSGFLNPKFTGFPVTIDLPDELDIETQLNKLASGITETVL